MAGTSWRLEAACATRTDLDWFDVDCNLAACLEVCRTCTVSERCLDEARQIDATDGIWAGVWGYRLHQAKQGGTHGKG